MSGICGIVPLDGAPVDPERLRAMTAALSGRGPDGRESRLASGAGLGHAWLRTDPDGAEARQPLTFDGSTWVVADARIDGQAALRAALVARGRQVARDCSDAALVLHAWHAWGVGCAGHLLGDFAFAIWDGARRRLFLARDHFGVKQLFHARVGASLVFANSFECLRDRAGVPADLDESVIADFLLFEAGRDPVATAFACIRRLPPASCLAAEGDSLRTWSYWDLPADPAVRPMKDADCLEEFGALLRTAVEDRLRTRRISVRMSGGLDSTAVAALAKAALSARGPHELHAHTLVYERLFHDEEGRYAALAAARLAVPLHRLAADDYALHSGDEFAGRFSEPFHAPDVDAVFHDSLRACALDARVVLTGCDGDALLEESPRPYVARLWRERRLSRLGTVLARHALSQRRVLPRAPWRRAPGRAAAFPSWVQFDFERRLALRERWREDREAAFGGGSIRPRALRDLRGLQRAAWFFEQFDAGVTGLALECRHPFLDLRLVEFCLGVEPVPWCVGKGLLRRAMRGLLPDEVVSRPKAPLAQWPGALLLERARCTPRAPALSAAVGSYVDPERVRAQARDPDPHVAWRALRGLTLDRWISRASQQTSRGRSHHEIAR